MVLIYLSAAWMAGLYLAAQVMGVPGGSPQIDGADQVPLLLLVGTALLPLCVAWFWRRRPVLRLAALCTLMALLGMVRYRVTLPRFDEHSLSTYNGHERVTLVGVVAAEPDVRDDCVDVVLRAETLALGGERSQDIEGRVLVRLAPYAEARYGDRLEVHGALKTPFSFEGFDYRTYLARKGIYSRMDRVWYTTLAHGLGFPPFARMLAFKRHAQHVIAEILPEPCAALLTGILLGYERGIPADLAADFNTTGTSHIIAISGFNFVIVAGAVSSLSVRLVGRRYAAWFSTTAIVLYTFLVGASAAVVRAAVMSCIAVWGEHLGRQNSAPNALFATALIMTAWDPYTLWDLGFLLSFAATCGLVFLADPFQRGFEWFLSRVLPGTWVDPVAKFLNESLVLTTCAQLTTLPIILYHFRRFSWTTLLSNVLILPPQPQVMLWGALATFAGLIWLPLGRVLGWVAWLFVAYTIWVVEKTASIHNMAVDLGTVQPVWVWGWYVLLVIGGGWMVQSKRKRREMWRVLARRLPTGALFGGLAIAAALVWLAVAALPDGRLHVTVLDVGQGDAVMIQTPTGHQVLVDGGPSPSQMLAHLGRRTPFWDRSLDVVVLTDLEEEHASGLVPVLERYRVDRLLFPSPACEEAACARCLDLAREKGIVSQSPIAGTRIDMGDGVLLTVLNPVHENCCPIVLGVTYGQTRFLLAGSANDQVEMAMLARQEPLRCDVLQVGLNGGPGVACPAFLQHVRPALAVISCDESERGGAPAQEVLDRLAEYSVSVARTDQRGSIEVISDGQRYEVRIGR